MIFSRFHYRFIISFIFPPSKRLEFAYNGLSLLGLRVSRHRDISRAILDFFFVWVFLINYFLLALHQYILQFAIIRIFLVFK